MSQTINILVNGENRACPSGMRLSELLQSMSLKPENVAIELNLRLVRMAQYATELKPGDKIEIVTFVGGG